MAIFYCLRFEAPPTWRARFLIYTGFEVLTAVVMKSSVFWDITLCSQSMSRRSISPPSSLSNKPHAVTFLGLLDCKYGGDMFLRNVD
jgi:hypothetical protein